MKYGVLIHKYTHNLGDDIQSYATSLFLPSIDYIVDREELDTFQSDNDELVAVIMNAWYLLKKWNWPPAKCIIPKLTGIHFAASSIERYGTTLQYEFLEGIGGEWLRSYGPVGFRDTNTLELCKKYDIDGYLSGCITLTLPKQKKIENEKKYICLVDLPFKIERKVKRMAKRKHLEVKIMSHFLTYDSDKMSWDERKKKVEEVLTIYQNALCVVTNRLHVSLPCLAMETPVLCIKKDIKENDRFSPYNEFLHYVSAKDFLTGKYNYDISNPPKNKDTYKEMRQNIIDDVNAFIKYTQDESMTKEDYIKIKYTDIERMKWQNKLMKYALSKFVVDNKEYIKSLKSQTIEYKYKKPIKELIKKFLK